MAGCCSLRHGRRRVPRLPNTKVDYDDFSDLDTIMDHAWVRIHPKFHSKEKSDAFVEDLKPESHENSKRLLYVALTRAREKVILEWPEYLPKTKGKWQGTYWQNSAGQQRQRLHLQA